MSDAAWIVTADHVLDGSDFVTGSISVRGRVFRLGDIGNRDRNPSRDVAVWSIPAVALMRYGISDLMSLPLRPPRQASALFLPVSSFFILGCPASKNKLLDFRNGKVPHRKITALALHAPAPATAGQLRFFYSGEHLAEAWASDRDKFGLKGMSGSPCLRIISDRKHGHLSVALAGVFTAWHKEQQRLSVAEFFDPWNGFEWKELRH